MTSRFPANYQWHDFDDNAGALVSELAQRIEVQLNAAIREKGLAVIAFSGGSTPIPLFEKLHTQTIDWNSVVVTLVDERWVPESHVLSNAALLKKSLLDKLPDPPRFVPLYRQAENVEDSVVPVLAHYCQATSSTLDDPRKFDVAILGMGGDGHTASFFPDAVNIVDLINNNTTQALQTCVSESTQVERITWSLPMLLDTNFLALHIVGKSKKQVYQHALQGDDLTELPIRSVVFQDKITLQVYYVDH